MSKLSGRMTCTVVIDNDKSEETEKIHSLNEDMVTSKNKAKVTNMNMVNKEEDVYKSSYVKVEINDHTMFRGPKL